MCTDVQSGSMIQSISLAMNPCNESNLQVTENDTQVLLAVDEDEEHYMHTPTDMNEPNLSVIQQCYSK
jgi:hypothetical protein